MPADLTEKELERLRLELWRRRAGGHMTMALSLDTVDALLASARAVRAGIAECEAVMAERGANNATANRRIVASRIFEKLTASAEPAAGEER